MVDNVELHLQDDTGQTIFCHLFLSCYHGKITVISCNACQNTLRYNGFIDVKIASVHNFSEKYQAGLSLDNTNWHCFPQNMNAHEQSLFQPIESHSWVPQKESHLFDNV